MIWFWKKTPPQAVDWFCSSFEPESKWIVFMEWVCKTIGKFGNCKKKKMCSVDLKTVQKWTSAGKKWLLLSVTVLFFLLREAAARGECGCQLCSDTSLDDQWWGVSLQLQRQVPSPDTGWGSIQKKRDLQGTSLFWNDRSFFSGKCQKPQSNEVALLSLIKFQHQHN